MSSLEFFVGVGEPFRNLTSAVYAVREAMGDQEFTDPVTITITDSGVHKPVRIEPDFLRPTGTNRLTIRAGVGERPVISGKADPARSQVGILVGNNVPYVTIQGIEFQDLIKGVVIGVNSHRAVVDKCRFRDCGNAAVWFYQADECLLSNSLLLDNDHGVVATKVRSVAILHNTFWNRARRSRTRATGKSYCLYLELQDDRGQGVEDTGTIHLFNNNIVSQTDFALLIHAKDLGHLQSNYNNWFVPGSTEGEDIEGGGLAEVRENLGTGVTNRIFVRDLHRLLEDGSSYGWRTKTGQDLNSISDDPEVVGIPPPAFDLHPLATSPLLVRGSTLYDAPAWIPDQTVLGFDLEGIARRQSCTIGAYEKCVRLQRDGIIFSAGNNPVEEPDGASIADSLIGESYCEEDVHPYDIAAAQYAKSVPSWTPRVHRGHFFVRDSSYYLYKKKRGVYIQDIQRSSFPLPTRMLKEGARLTVGGRDVTTTADWTIDGLCLVLHHHGLEDAGESADVLLEGYARYWNEDEGLFQTKWVRNIWKMTQAWHDYVLPSNPIPGSPIVVTDDLIAPGNMTGLDQEFRMVQEGEDTRIDFPRVNSWANSDFSYVDPSAEVLLNGVFDTLVTGYLPMDHEVESPSATIGCFSLGRMASGTQFVPLRGFRSLVIGPGASENFVAQRVPIDSEKAYTFSAHATTLGTEPSALDVWVDFLDYEQRTLSSHGPFPVTVPGNSGPDVDWIRFGLSFYAEPDRMKGRPEFSRYAYPVSTGIPAPGDAEWAFIRISPGTTTGNPVALDALQIEHGYRPTPYTRIPKGTDLTVEYEEEEGVLHDVVNLSLQPVRNPQANGFLAIIPLPARQWDDDAPAMATTLSDYKWPWGRVNLLPWAKVSGFNKYRRVTSFSTWGRHPVWEPVSLSPNVAFPRTIRVEPMVVFANQDTEGERFAVEVLDEYGNPYAHEHLRASCLDPTGQFPGYLAAQTWGYYSHLGQSVVLDLNEAGSQSLQWIPPESEDVSYVGPKPPVLENTGLGGGYAAGYVDVGYRVYPGNHGAVVLRDEQGDLITLEGDLETGNVSGTYQDGHTLLPVGNFPVPGSVEVFASVTGEPPVLHLLESFVSPIPSRHYLVNYEVGEVAVAGEWRHPFRISYRRRLAWRDPRYARRIYIDKEALDQVSGQMTLRYDAVVDLLLEALPPTGSASTTPAFLRVDAVAQHNDRVVG